MSCLRGIRREIGCLNTCVEHAPEIVFIMVVIRFESKAAVPNVLLTSLGLHIGYTFK
jgi:hypothetical protein